ncbi:MAG: hypothetical protein ACRC9V_03680 [Aeromonas sp.]
MNTVLSGELKTIGNWVDQVQYRERADIFRTELEAMLEIGVIEESNSDEASPIVLVPKTEVLCGIPQDECGVKIRRLSNASGRQVASLARHDSF